MKKDLKVFLQLCAINFKHLLIYRASFWITFILMAGWTGAYVIFIEVIFGHIDTLAGWTKGQTLLVLAFYYLFQNISDIFYKDNFEDFGEIMRRGELDFRVIKPTSSRMLVFFYRMRFDQIASLMVTGALFVYAYANMPTHPSAWFLAIGLLFTMFSIVLYFSLLSIISTFAFWIQKSDTFRVLMWNVSQVARYPRHIYIGIVGKILTFFIPLAGLASIPAEVALRMPHGAISFFFACVTVFFFILSKWFWDFGLRRYSSAG